MMPVTRFLTLLLLTLPWLHGCDSSTAQPRPKPPVVEVAEVSAGATTLWENFTGRVAAPETVDLRPRVGGYIESVNFTEGELVTRGQVLFEIDPRPYQARVKAAVARLAQAKSQLTLADSQARRARQLLASHAISREEFDRRQAASDSAHAAVDAAAAAQENARLELSYTRVTAPISGRAGRALVTPGNLAGADQTLLTTLVSVDPMYVYFEGSQRTLANSRALLESHQPLQVNVGLGGEDGYPHHGQLDFVDNRLNSHTGTLQLRAVVANPDGSFRPGQFARVEMPTANLSSALLVDRKAVLTDQDRRFVYVVGSDNRALRRDVQTGQTQGDRVLVRSGLHSGERIVVNGLQKIFVPGMEVQPQLVQMQGEDPARQVAQR
ncbi:efflux RND transporter periplasmic adaptor subunit [Microbulbifer sp. SAOS-129_SWC]|uniref:efflux RND transporter periplasmic adaptor subunit n=1 Tax=Microbulbifer sp. SAOS-129_SWC TaxID=3145235 RepID=UPI0032166A43